MNRSLIYAVPFVFLLALACTDLPLNVHGDTPTDGQLKIMALTDVVEILARRPEMMPGLIQGISDVSKGDKTALHDRLEEELISILTRRGYFVGAVAAPEEESETEEALREAHEEKEMVVSGAGADGNTAGAQDPVESTPSSSPSSPSRTEDSTHTVAKPGTLEYRLVECRVIYTRAGSGVKRQAVAVVHFRIPSSSGEGYAWAGDITGSAEDVVSTTAAEELIDTRYADIGPTSPEEEETPILEPIIVTAVTVGLIVLFSFTSQ
ncbi:MAG TPA: hypothetical protein VM054_10495 [bacterium]|nr:hypothetical protein [bacterium]